MKTTEDRCMNVPSWSLPMSMIVEVATVADELGISQSSIVRDALAEKFKAMKDSEAVVEYDKK